MAAKPPTVKELATALCKAFPDTASQTLGKRLYNENKERFTYNAAKCAIRRARGQQGKRNRLQKTSTRTSKSSNSPQCPPSAAEPWLPVQIDGPCRLLVLSDLHIPYHDVGAIEAAVAYGRKLKPDVVELNGDAMDFYRCSRFQQDPKKRTLTEEIKTGREFLRWIRYRFPKARIIYKLGNHDERWNTFLWNRAPELFDLENVQLRDVMKFADFGIEEVGDSPVMAGSLPILHGHEIGKGIFSPVNPARGAYLRTNHTVLIGHLHRPSSHADPDMWHKEIMTWSTGCLCNLQPEYARVNKWAWGFAHVEVASNNEFDMHNLRISEYYKVRAA